MLTRVSIQNYKSLAEVDVELGPLTVLVGQNSTGKSNFIDAIHFVSDAVTVGLDQAVIRRGGIDAIKCAALDDVSSYISFNLYFRFKDENGEYNLSLSDSNGEHKLQLERCVFAADGYTVEDGTASLTDASETTEYPLPTHVELMLPFISLETQFGIIRRFLTDATYYAILPSSHLREPQKAFSLPQLMADAFNLNSVLRRMKKETPDAFDRLCRAFTQMVPGVQGLDVELIGGYLVTKLQYQYGDKVETFDLSQESDGTLRLLGILTALYQVPTPPLITIEEPELAVHPGALRMLYEVLEEASHRTQLIITTHSPDLISYCAPENLRIVEKVEGATKIAPLEQRQIDIVNEQLFSTSDLLRIEGLRPERPS